ncbi:ABC transporter permease [Metabacillus niabensis]|uniref:ABC-2 type transport system permease protein n=1 Tax=Metabacillus niabensis TaxID=324854 RepID=A0ABT9Z7F1_9BACI|nr:ABC transporter permease subunit [Metabacillus niabensis]MDQ0228192.1 ABC-2 type transport system permease protein [Metabacillus niabensis]
MNTFQILFKKEWLEAWRDKKLIWLPIAMAILAISQPISLYYMPEILNAAGNLPEGTIIKIPVPTGEEVLSSTLSQIGIIGTAIFILSVMGCISQERKSGVLHLLMTRPVESIHYIGSKWLANAVILIVSFIISYGLAYYYTNTLFNDVHLERFVVSLIMYSCWIIFVMTVTVFIGTIFKKNGEISGITIFIVAMFVLCQSLFPKYMAWNPASAMSSASSILTNGKWENEYFITLGSSALFIIVLLALTMIQFKRYKSY